MDASIEEGALDPRNNYYLDEDRYGDYQFSPLSEVIDAIALEAESDPDSYITKKPRHLIILAAKRGVKELTADMANDVLALELEIGDDLQFILPQDFVDWVCVSLVGENGELLPLDINRKSNRAITYLQDHDYGILLDDEGFPLESDGNNIYNKKLEKRGGIGSVFGGRFQKDTSKLSKYGEFSIDKRRGVIVVDSSLSGKHIVLEYFSDGLQWEEIHETEITVHKYFEEPLKNWIYWKLIENGRNVPEREKMRAERVFYGSRQKAFARFANVNLIEISKAFRATLKWIKT